MKKAINVFIVFLVLILIGLVAWQYLQGRQNSEITEPTPEPTLPVITELVLTIDEPYAFFDGERVMIDEENPRIMPVIVDDRTILPLRFIAESFGMNIAWDDATHVVTLSTNDGFDIELTIDSRVALVNKNKVDLDAPAIILEERTFLPLRFIAEQMNCDVNYDPEIKEIKISYNNVELTPEELEAKRLIIQDKTAATMLAKAAAKLCTQDSKYYDSIQFSQEVIIDIELLRPYLPDAMADFSTINTGVAPWIISTVQGEYKVTDSSEERKVYFQGEWVNITPPPITTPLLTSTTSTTPTSASTPTPFPTHSPST